MKEQDVEFISTQFGIDKQIVEASVNDGTLSARLKDSLSKKIIYNNDEFETFKKNHALEVQNSYFNDLVEKAKKGDIPQDLYKPVKGSAYQQLEREIAKEHEIAEFKDIKDLLGKVIQKHANGKGDPDLTAKIEDLKKANLKLTEEKENAVKDVEAKYKKMTLEREKLDILSRVPFDFSEVKADEAEKVKARTQTLLRSVFDAEYVLDYENDKAVVKDKEGKIKQNKATLEPVSAYDVMIDLAKEYNLKLKSSDRGGQGGKSSYESTGIFSSVEDFNAYCEKNNINPLSKEGTELYRKSGLYKHK